MQDYRDKGIIPYTQIAGKILYKLSDINRLLLENYRNKNTPKVFLNFRSVFVIS
ncbi:hypothetical protein PORCAN_2017 [Porphyromonas crevioricanis JCM 13913]|nr:hypothetical protein PORCAN_2017 [Porphyromonas crevioricanis JCM 13913]